MTEQLYNPLRDKTVVILGYTCSGKSTLCKELFNVGTKGRHYSIIHTDDYIERYDWEEALYKIMDDVADQQRHSSIVIEGVQGYRLLRKWAQTGRGSADLVITCVAPLDVRSRRYEARNNGKALPRHFDTVLSKIWMDWLALDQGATRRVQYDTVLNKIV